MSISNPVKELNLTKAWPIAFKLFSAQTVKSVV